MTHADAVFLTVVAVVAAVGVAVEFISSVTDGKNCMHDWGPPHKGVSHCRKCRMDTCVQGDFPPQENPELLKRMMSDWKA